MSFFPNLSPYVDDVYESTNIGKNNEGGSAKDKLNSNVPPLPYTGYYPDEQVPDFPNKSSHIRNINEVCAKTSWACKYDGIKIGSDGALHDASNMKLLLKQQFGSKMDMSFLDSIPESDILCQLPNIMIMMGYKYDSTDTSVSGYHGYKKTDEPNIYLKVNSSASSAPMDQTFFNACQTLMTRTRLYESGDLKKGGFFGMKDLFVKFASLRPILILVLLITIYLLVQGTLSSFDLVFNIASIAANRSIPTWPFLAFVGVGMTIMLIIASVSATQQIEKSNTKFGSYDISRSPYGEQVSNTNNTKGSDKALTVGMMIMIYVIIFFMYAILRKRSITLSMKIGISSIGLLLLTCVVFLLFYWIPILSLGNDNNDDVAYGISRPLKVWLSGENREEVGQLTSNKFIDLYLQRFFAIFAIFILIITLFYISRAGKPVISWHEQILEGIMVSCAILALPILWIFNWYVGMKFFMVYPMILLMVRYLRYPLYYIARGYYMNSPDAQRANPGLRAEFDKPENYSPSWDLLGLTVYKTFIKMMGNKSIYSDLFVDPANGYKNISSNSYVTGHYMKLLMRRGSSTSSSYGHHIATSVITLIVLIFILFGVIGKENLA